VRDPAARAGAAPRRTGQGGAPADPGLRRRGLESPRGDPNSGVEPPGSPERRGEDRPTGGAGVDAAAARRRAFAQVTAGAQVTAFAHGAALTRGGGRGIPRRMDDAPPSTALRRGWTTGACATAAARAAHEALAAGRFPDPVEIALPGGRRVAFALAETALGPGWARAGVVKDAGDDPDVTHGALIRATLRPLTPGAGVTFRAGEGVGMVTRPGLPIPPGEPAVNPVPRAMMRAAIAESAARFGLPDVEIELSVPGGAALAEKTLNGRLGVVGGLSILGTRGVVIPFSCSAWIHSIHRGVDVARAAGCAHVAGATGGASERAIAALDGLPEVALLEMGDFVGPLLKYLRAHPVPRVTVAGGFAKLTKLAQGRLDLHSRAGAVDMGALAALAAEAGAGPALVARIAATEAAGEALSFALAEGVDLPALVAARAVETAATALRGAPVGVDVAVFDRHGALLARSRALGG
jgi:cobalt-precorrin-5B (C1)-methyltransferase